MIFLKWLKYMKNMEKKCIFLPRSIFERQTKNNSKFEGMNNKIKYTVREVFYKIGNKYTF